MTGGGTDEFELERPRLISLAYRITGSVVEAEDIVQDAWLRWQGASSTTIERPAAWLTTVTSRLALDRLRSAHHRRESYPGPWLPEPVVADPSPEAIAEQADSLAFGFLTVLERLAPVERVVFLLADVFDVPMAEIATVVDKSEPATRQVASRARRRVRAEPVRFAASDADAWQATASFLLAAQDGDLGQLVDLLSDDAVLISDGGPDTHAARRPVQGPDRVARFVANLAKRLTADLSFALQLLNGVPGVVARAADGSAVFALAVERDGAGIHHLYAIINPDKLRRL